MAVSQHTPPREEPRKRGRPKESKTTAGPKKKRAKSDAKKTRTPAKVDINRQCGVPLVSPMGELTGFLCSRSLTCKTHSMGSKRAVRGRSRPYDVLLANYQRQHNLKSATSTGPGTLRRSGSSASADAQNERARAAEEEANRQDPPLPPAEEIAAVLHGATRSLPIPLATSFVVSTRLRSEQFNLRELLFKTAVSPPTPLPPPPPGNSGRSSSAAIMAATAPVLGRCVMYNPVTGAGTLRPSQIAAHAALHKALKKG